MSSGPKLLEQMRDSSAGWAERDFFSVLEYYGYELVRHVRHGAMYRHPELLQHRDPAVRTQLAHVVIPKARTSKAYVAEKVIASVECLLKLREERADD